MIKNNYITHTLNSIKNNNKKKSRKEIIKVDHLSNNLSGKPL